MWKFFNCYVSGRHDFGMWCEAGQIFLRCPHCGKRTIGGVARDQVEQDDGIEAPRQAHADRFPGGDDLRQSIGDMAFELHEITPPLP